MKKYDFENMDDIQKDEARTITENGVFIANSGSWDLWAYYRTIYSIPISGSGCSFSVWCSFTNLRRHLYYLRQVCGYAALVPDYWQYVDYDFLGGLGIA